MDIRKEIANLSVQGFLEFVNFIYCQGVLDAYDQDDSKDTEEYMAEVAWKALYGPMKNKIFGEEEWQQGNDTIGSN